MMGKRGVWALFIGLAAACSSTSTTTVIVRGEQLNGSCPSAPQSLTGTLPPGATCSTPTECATFCCACKTGTNHWLGAGCGDTCADQNTVCNNVPSAAFCP